ncbi:hypothetical protein INS49_015516 [Diaporthe citri]|uniref:uncharacterized protein n=1 Tax=Diaporthe citri TaxID=83186 RepID=UPI001C7E4C6B|nr:uncharacterized protein INS49_015516 [Diaporthe citri]KAG6356129.1 hypothetical protein INS49_015516 [Diaporthe citri]
MQEYHPFPIYEHIKGAVLYKDDPWSPTLLHPAGDWKDWEKDIKDARLPCPNSGDLKTPPGGGNAEVLTFATDGTNLDLFAHYAAPSEHGKLEYQQYPVDSADLTG